MEINEMPSLRELSDSNRCRSQGSNQKEESFTTYNVKNVNWDSGAKKFDQ